MHLIGMLSCIKHISYLIFINNYNWSSKTDVPCFMLLMFFHPGVVKVYILFQKMYFNLVSFKKHLILYLKWIDLVSWKKGLVWNQVARLKQSWSKGYVLLRGYVFDCLEPETGYTISLLAPWKSCFFWTASFKRVWRLAMMVN